MFSVRQQYGKCIYMVLAQHDDDEECDGEDDDSDIGDDDEECDGEDDDSDIGDDDTNAMMMTVMMVVLKYPTKLTESMNPLKNWLLQSPHP